MADRIAVVTGAGRGIGREIAAALAEAGATIACADIDGSTAETCARHLRETVNGDHAAFTVDVRDSAAVTDFCGRVIDAFGRADVLVNNAGIALNVAAEAMTDEQWHDVIDVNLNGVFYGMRYQIPAIAAAGGGGIVNVSSILGSVGFRGASAYVAAKHALVGLTRAAALDHAGEGVRVNAVGPAFIATPLLTNNLEQEMLDGLAALHPVGRIGTSEEVSALVCFLLSDRASFITGSYHLVDGGYTAQ